MWIEVTPGVEEEKLIRLVQKCRQQKDPWQAKLIHTQIKEKRLETHPSLCNYVIPMLVECGSLCDARNTFDQLPFPLLNEHSWNILISGYVAHGEPREAFALYHKMQECSCPSECTYLSLLHACIRLTDIGKAQQIHIEMVRRGLEMHLHNGSAMLGNSLVDVYSKCGALVDAYGVFINLPAQDAVSWNTLIAGCVDQELNQEAIEVFHRMQLQNVSPNHVTYVSALKACGRLKDYETGQLLHLQLSLRGLENELSVGSILIDMYGKCNALAEAHRVLDGLQARDTILWNAMIALYIEHDLFEQARESFHLMQVEDNCPDCVTFLCCLKSCNSSKDIHEMHAEVTKRGFGGDISIGSTLVDMYVRFGSISDARQTFDLLTIRSAVSWSIMLVGYSEHGLVEESFNCFNLMQEEGVLPDVITYSSTLKACGFSRAKESGQTMHSKLTKRGWERELSLGNALIDMYGKCGLVADAHFVFDRLIVRQNVSWAALISAYVEDGQGQGICNWLELMQLEGISPDLITFLSILRTIENLEAGQRVHTEITKRGLEMDLDMGSILVHMYQNCDAFMEARQVFSGLADKDAVLWNTLIAGYAEHGLDNEVLSCFKQMQLGGTCADHVTFAFFLRACGNMGALETGREVHGEIRKSGLDRDLVVGSMLIDMYGVCGSVHEARKAFNKLLLPDVVSWTTLIQAYGKNHEGEMAVACYMDMQKQGVKPDSTTFACLVSACAHASLILQGQEFFKLMIEDGIKPSVDHYVCMVDLFARSGHIYEAEEYIAAMQFSPSSEILRSLIMGCKIHGEVEVGQKCFHLILEMDEDINAACLLMSDLYVNALRWSDAMKVDPMMKDVVPKEMPVVTVLEKKGESHKIIVYNSEMENVFGTSKCHGFHIRDTGFAPDIDVS